MNKTHTILVADDDALMRISLIQSLEKHGFKVLRAEDGEQAEVLALSAHPDLIILDVEMPKVNGMKVIEHLRNDAWGKDVPIVFLTSFDTSDQMIQVISTYNPTFYLRKTDVTPEYIAQKVKETLKV